MHATHDGDGVVAKGERVGEPSRQILNPRGIALIKSSVFSETGMLDKRLEWEKFPSSSCNKALEKSFPLDSGPSSWRRHVS